MKSFILFFLLTLPAAVFTQHEEGKITYTETMKMDMEIPEEHKEELQGLFPETSSTEKVLLFNREESIYKNVEDQGDEVVEAGSEESGMRIKMVMSRPDLQLYKNLKKKEMIQKEDLLGRPFLITQEFQKFPWKLVNESKEILGYTCQKAVMRDGDTDVAAWYTPQIPVSNGPMHLGQLPGMILEVDINDGQTMIVATDVSFEPLKRGSIKAPSRGKKMSREAFRELEAEKEKEMEEAYGSSGGNVIIRQRRD